MKKTFFLSFLSMLLFAFSFTAKSQEGQPVTIHMSQEGYADLQNNPEAGVLLIAMDDQNYRLKPGTYNPHDPWDPPCDEQMTPQLAAQCQAAANACCCPVFICVQGANCAWYAYIFRPNNGCDWAWPDYAEAVAAVRY